MPVAAPAGNAAVIGKNADNHTALRHFFVEELDEIKFRCLALSLALKIVPDAAVSNRPRQSPKAGARTLVRSNCRQHGDSEFQTRWSVGDCCGLKSARRLFEAGFAGHGKLRGPMLVDPVDRGLLVRDLAADNTHDESVSEDGIELRRVRDR